MLTARLSRGLARILAALVPCLVLAAPAIADGPARFNRVDYGSHTTTSDAARYQLMEIGYGSSSTSQQNVRNLITQIHQTSPATKVLLYKFVSVNPTDPTGIGGCLPYHESQPYGGVPLADYLRDYSGQPIRDSTYGFYYLDPTVPAVQNACAQSAISMAQASGYNGIFFDSIAPAVTDYSGLSPSKCENAVCQSNTAWQAGQASWIKDESAALHGAGLLVIGNIAFAYGANQSWWSAFQNDGLDGAMEESFTSGTDGLPVPLAQWRAELQNEQWSEANHKYLQANADVGGNAALNTYGLATLLLAAHGHSSWDTASGCYGCTSPYWFPAYDAALALGKPSGPYVLQGDGLYVRQFAGGVVYVNPTSSAIADPRFGVVPAHTGHVG